jgi:hypothetical protein
MFDNIKDVKIIENLISDDSKFTLKGGQELTAKQIKDLEKKWSDINKKRRTLLVFWDDTVQYTTIGLINLFLEIFEMDKNWDYSEFFYRSEELRIRNDFIRDFFNKRNKTGLTDELIYSIEKRYYDYIIQISPMSTLFIPLMRTETLHSVYNFVFRAPFGSESTMQGLSRSIQNEQLIHKTKTNVIALNKDMSCVEFIRQHGEQADIVCTVYGKELYDFYTNNGITKKNILCPSNHSGFSESFLDSNAFFFKKAGVTANGIELSLYNEGIAIA